MQRFIDAAIFTVFGALFVLVACSESPVPSVNAEEGPKVAALSKPRTVKGSWCDIKKNEVSVGHGYVRAETDTIETASPIADGERGVYVTFCSNVLK